MMLSSPALAQAPATRPAMPANRQIKAVVERTLSAPASDPMHMPTDVAIDSRGRIFVADGANDRILRFSPQGELEAAVGRIGDEKLSRPVGLTVDAKDGLWIADSGHHRVLVAAADGKSAQSIALPASDDGKPFDPTDVAVTADGKWTYIIDNDHHRIAKRDNAGGDIRLLGKHGRALGQFEWPFMVAVDAQGTAYVTEAMGGRVQRLDARERWLGRIGEWGVQLGQLYRPKGVAVDRAGRVLVSDSTLEVVQVFDSEGGLIGVLTDDQGQPVRFKHPMGMALDGRGRLYVVELRADRVAVVRLDQPAAGAAGQERK